MISSKDEFFKRYKFDQATIDAAPSWEVLTSIAADHESRKSALEESLDVVLRRLTRIPGVHSTRGRIKDADHLMEKCIRKKYHDVHCANYCEKVTDLIGARALHLYKSDWSTIHQHISRWDIVGQPIAYYRKGDDVDAFEQAGCKSQEHPNGYRSVHYMVNVQVMEVRTIVEVQVRTLFEETWSEIDHSVRYPYGSDPAVAEFLALFNRIAGTADEMGDYVGRLRGRLEGMSLQTREEITKRDIAIKSLEDQILHLTNTTQEEKRLLQATIERLKSPTTVEVLGKVAGAVSVGALEMINLMAAHRSAPAKPHGKLTRLVDTPDQPKQSSHRIKVGRVQPDSVPSDIPSTASPVARRPTAKKM